MKITKTLITTIGIIIVFGLSFYSCKKEIFLPNLNSDIEEKITSWLNSQKSVAKNSKNAKTTSIQTAKNANVDLLNENLDFDGASTQTLDKQLDLLVVPVKDAVKIKKNLQNNSTLTLFLLTDKTGKIKDGGLIYYVPDEGRQYERFNANDIKNLLISKKLNKDNGKYKFLSVKGTWISQIEVRNGKQYSISNVQPKEKIVRKTQRTTGCIDWYLITTIYYTDGSTETTRDYVGTTCSDCDTGEYVSLCRSGDMDAGSNEEEAEVVEEVDDAISLSVTETANSTPSTGLSEPSIITVSWHATFKYTYTRKGNVGVFSNPRQNKPYPIPVSYVYTYNGSNYATAFPRCTAYTTGMLQLTFNSARFFWDFVHYTKYVYNYVDDEDYGPYYDYMAKIAWR